MLTDGQQSLLNANFAFSVVQCFFMGLYIFNPINRESCGLGKAIPLIFGYVSGAIAAGVMPIAVFITNGAAWRDTMVHESFVKIWFMTYIVVNALVFIGAIV